MIHKDLLEHAKAKRWITNDTTLENFDWKLVMEGTSGDENELEPSGREKQGLKLLKDNFSSLLANKEEEGSKDPSTLTSTLNMAFHGMANVLRDGQICMQGSFQTTGSQISLLPSDQNLSNDIHFFSSYNPSISIYKPFIFPVKELSNDDIQKLKSMNEKPKPLWQMFHKMNRRDKKALRETLIEKEREIVSDVLKSESVKELSKYRNLFNEHLDQEMLLIQSPR